MSQKKYTFAYDFMGISNDCWKIRYIFKENNIFLIKNFSADASIPKKIKKNYFQRIYDNFYPRKPLGGSIFRKLKNRITLLNHKNFIWDLGIFWETNHLIKQIKKNVLNILNLTLSILINS